MADEVARLVAVLETDMKRFEKGMEGARKTADRQFGRIEKRMQTTERRFMNSFGTMGGTALTSLIRRYTAWGIVIGTLDRAMQTAAKTNQDAAAATAELNRAWTAFAESAAIVLSPALSASAKLLKTIADINKELTAGNVSGAWKRFQQFTSVVPSAAQLEHFQRMGMVSPTGPAARAAGIPFAPPPDKIPITGSQVGAHATNAQIEDAARAAKEKADIEKGIIQDAFNTKQHFLEQEVEAIKNAAQIEADIRQHYFDVQQSLWETEADELADFHARAQAAWDSYYERQAEMAEDSTDARLSAAQQFFGELATLTRSSSNELKAIGKAAAIIQATMDGVLAVQNALAHVPFPFNIAVAAAIATTTAANVAEIAGMEKGGRVRPGEPYIVGEKRPELFVPDSAGTIVPRVPNIASPVASRQSLNQSIHVDARGAQIGVAEQIEAALLRAAPGLVGASVREVNRNFPQMMIRTQRDRL